MKQKPTNRKCYMQLFLRFLENIFEMIYLGSSLKNLDNYMSTLQKLIIFVKKFSAIGTKFIQSHFVFVDCENND